MGYYEDQELLGSQNRAEVIPYHTNTTAAGRKKPEYTRTYKDVAFDMFLFFDCFKYANGMLIQECLSNRAK